MSNSNIPYRYTLIHPTLIRELKEEKTSLGSSVLIPHNLNDGKFLSNLFLDNYTRVFNKVVSVNEVSPEGVNKNDCISKSIEFLKTCMIEEKAHKADLINLAKKIVEDSFDIIIGKDVNINIQLGYEETTNKLKSLPPTKPKPTNNIKLDVKSYEDTETARLEVDKRRLFNCLTQGISNTFNNIFFMYEDELNAINPRLFNTYRKMLPNAEIFYYFVDLGTTILVPGGLCHIDTDTDEPSVSATAMCFPILIHEIIKGLFELISLNGLPKDKNLLEYVLERSDYYLAEGWDMVLGVPLWGNIVENIPHDLLMDKHQVFYELVTLDVNELKKIMPDILGNTQRGKDYMFEICEKIRKDKSDEDMANYLHDLDSSDDDFIDPTEL